MGNGSIALFSSLGILWTPRVFSFPTLGQNLRTMGVRYVGIHIFNTSCFLGVLPTLCPHRIFWKKEFNTEHLIKFLTIVPNSFELTVYCLGTFSPANKLKTLDCRILWKVGDGEGLALRASSPQEMVVMETQPGTQLRKSR